MENYKSILFFIILIFCRTGFPYEPEEGKVTATFGPYINRTNFNGYSTVGDPGYLGGLGLVAVGDISANRSLEIAMIYTPQVFYRDIGGKILAEKVQTIHITMGHRWWLSPFLSTSLAFFSAYPMGTKEVVHDDGAISQIQDTSARDKTEYGFDGAVQSEVWGNSVMAVILEGRYSYSVTPKKDEHSDQYGILIGVRYIVQAEKKVEHMTKP